MERKKLHLEYVLHTTSDEVLWMAIGTISGLEAWFAKKITQENTHRLTFHWSSEEQRTAEITGIRSYSYFRFKFVDCPYPREYVEFRMTPNELTNDYVFEIVDFCDADEADDITDLWNYQVESLRRSCGF